MFLRALGMVVSGFAVSDVTPKRLHRFPRHHTMLPRRLIIRQPDDKETQRITWGPNGMTKPCHDRCSDTKNKAVRLMMFPLSLTGEAKSWLDELNEGTIETWDELRTAFISRFFLPAIFNRILREIRAFSQHENESLTNAWLRMKEML
nr:reverse transcriptase domain-containing protein [Tanacetum cinerariifolium]